MSYRWNLQGVGGGQGLQSNQVGEARVSCEDQVLISHTAVIGYPGRETGYHCISHSIRTPRKYAVPLRLAKLGATFNLE